MKKILLLQLLLIISIISSAQIRISGTVTNVFNKAPLHKAIVTLNGSDNTLITDENGFFTVVLKESGIYDLEVSKNGYKSLSEELMLNKSIDIQIMLTSNAGAKEPTFTSTTIAKPEEKKYLKEDEFKIAKEKRQKQLEEEKIAEKRKQEEFLAKKKTIETNKRVNSTSSITNSSNKNSATLSGIIRDKYTKQAISKAIISFDGMKKVYTTTNNGEFKFKLEKGEYIMHVKSKGYKEEIATIPVQNNLDITVLLTKTDIKTITTDEVVVIATRATSKTPTSFTKINRKELLENSLGKDLPFLLELTPSVVATSDGGNGVGYTSMRIRGSDMTRINFTINGFPLNDAESQGVWLVNTPDLSSDVEDIQIQRGVGTSTNGAGAFGASVNINTNKKNEKAYAELFNSFGSFNTMKNTIRAGTGLLYDHFTFDGRFSHITSDGYIDRADVKMFAYAFRAGYYNEKSSIIFNLFSGKEKTYQAWNGVNRETMENDRTYNISGTDWEQKAVPYENEIDNYQQDNYQLSFDHKFGASISANLGFHYTKGKGYFEQYKVDEDLIDYGVLTPTANTDLVRRRWLDNHFYGTIFSLNHKIKNLSTTLGGAWNQYDGDHFGEIIWSKNATGIDIKEFYYLNNGLKTDFNTFLKAEYTLLKKLVLYGDIQYRRVSYSVDGFDNDQRKLFEDADYNFINPKVGATLTMGEKQKSQLYASFAVANKEPSRNDFIDNDIDPKSESLMNFELGFRHRTKKVSYAINSFYMKYKDQLVLTGELNDVGSAVRVNVDNSFRTGLELELAYEFSKYFGLSGAGTWSLNEIAEFTDGNGTIHDKTKIAYSPSLIANLTLYTKAFKGFKLAFINKYVGEQFLDNTSNKDKSLSAYFLSDARISYSITPKFMQEIEFIFKANNLFNTKYSSNGYVYWDTPYFYPQAGTNFEGGVNLNF